MESLECLAFVNFSIQTTCSGRQNEKKNASKTTTTTTTSIQKPSIRIHSIASDNVLDDLCMFLFHWIWYRFDIIHKFNFKTNNVKWLRLWQRMLHKGLRIGWREWKKTEEFVDFQHNISMSTEGIKTQWHI